jgi:hypothetical protein
MNSSGKKIDWLSLISLLVIVGGVCFLIFVGRSLIKNETSVLTTQKTGIIDTSEIKYCDYAKNTLEWLDKKRDVNGKYFASVNCDLDKKVCDENIPAGLSGHDAIPAIWARYSYIKKTGDKSQTDQLKKDIDFYYDQTHRMEVQNDFWNCKLLSQLDDKTILDDNYLMEVGMICQTSTYYDNKEVENGKVINKIDYPDWKSLSKTNPTSLNLDVNFRSKYKSFVTYPSDFVARYKKSKNQADLDVANAYFNGLLTNYYVDNGSFSFADRCLLAISSLDLYSINNDARYLDWAKTVYDDFFTKDGIKTQGANPECGFLNIELAKYDGANKANYQKKEKDLLETLISNYWDGNGGKNVLTKEEGFFDVGQGLAGRDAIHGVRIMRDTQIIISIIYDIPMDKGTGRHVWRPYGKGKHSNSRVHPQKIPCQIINKQTGDIIGLTKSKENTFDRI